MKTNFYKVRSHVTPCYNICLASIQPGPLADEFFKLIKEMLMLGIDCCSPGHLKVWFKVASIAKQLYREP